nr:hypothetical protein [uncultured Campylobacter sp.]
MDIIKHNMAELVLALNHNYREEKTTNTAFKANNDYLMLDCKDFKELQQRAFNIIAERESAYTERTGQKVQAKTAKAVEIIIEVNEDTTAQEILESYGEYFKNNFGVEILGIAIHRDEGYLIGKEPPHRRLTSGIEFELDQDTGKYYELVSDGKNYKRGTELDITAFKEIKNNHAQIIFSNLRADGSSVTSKHDNFKVFDKSFFKDFSNNWQKIYNQKFQNKKPLPSSSRKAETDNSEKSSVFEDMLQLIAEKIIQGTRNKQKLNESLAQYIQDTQKPIKRIKSYKHFLGRLNKLAYTDEALNKRDYATFLSQMRESGANVKLQQILLEKLTQMSEEELKEGDSSLFGKFYGFFQNLLNPKELENTKEELENTKKENTKLKTELDTAKTELKKQINEELEDNSQKHTALKPLFLSSDELDIYAKNKEIVAQAKDALTSFKTAEMISALKALRKQNRELEDILKKRASKNYADLKARSGSKIAEGSKTTQTLTQTEKTAENISQIAEEPKTTQTTPRKRR